MSGLDELAKTYEPGQVEPGIREFWAKGGYFHPDPNDPREAYTIIIPPPNVTGALHGGHALNNTLQDILVRWHRMRQFNTMWMPGTDHAGIATQAVVEKNIFLKEKKNRHDLGRDELVKRIWEWKEQYGNRILGQLNLMGCSCDWDRTRFTLDEVCARAVRHTFFQLFRDGLIVRGKRLVNWDTHLQTAVADDEVYHETVKGHFYHFKYPVIEPKAGEPAFVHIATTRPETMLGDTAVAVHPDPEGSLATLEAKLKAELAQGGDAEEINAKLAAIQERRQNHLAKLIQLRDMARGGRMVMLPLVDRPIPLICDEWADPMLGTGCVKITPAHDINDYGVGVRQKLQPINVMTPDGRIASLESHTRNKSATDKLENLPFATKGREAVVAAMKELDLVEKIEDRDIEVGHSDRSKTPIEPFLSDQWFVRMGDLPKAEAAKIEGLRGSSGLAQLAMDQVCEKEHASVEERKACGKVHFFPARYAKTYLDWLSEKRDWCISRQLWWGHQIPVWRFIGSGEDCGTRMAFLTDLRKKPHVEVQCYNVEGTERISWDEWCMTVGKASREFQLLVCILQDDPSIINELAVWKFERDPDVLDTWFSSALWPHSTMGWPEQTAELKKYYPGSVLSTAREIITLWVARMVLTGMYNLGHVPFHDVYIHAVIQDGQGRPFKKTLGNGYDPVDIIEMYGADALRYTMAAMSTETQDIRMPMKKVKLPDGRELQTSERFELGRNFANKLWNAARFAFMNLTTDGERQKPTAIKLNELPIEDRWILSRVSQAAAEVQDALEHFQFSRAITAARDFFWDSLCDWYLELVKSRISENRQAEAARQVLAFALDQSIRLLGPFMPFITERLWKQLNELVPSRSLPGLADLDAPEALVIATYPPTDGWPMLNDPQADAVFADLQIATRAVRDIRQTRDVPPRQSVDVVVRVPAERVPSMKHEAHVIRQLANVGELTIDPNAERPANSAALVIGDMQIFVAGVIDAAAEKARLGKDLANLDKQIAGIDAKLSNESFIARAPADIVERERQRRSELQAKRDTVLRAIQELE